eukprot:365159-Chlamydomonas_euryale.AAC.24
MSSACPIYRQQDYVLTLAIISGGMARRSSASLAVRAASRSQELCNSLSKPTRLELVDMAAALACVVARREALGGRVRKERLECAEKFCRYRRRRCVVPCSQRGGCKVGPGWLLRSHVTGAVGYSHTKRRPRHLDSCRGSADAPRRGERAGMDTSDASAAHVAA